MIFLEQLLIVVCIIAAAGLLVWGILKLLPMPDQFKNAIYVVTVIGLAAFVMVFLLQAMGVIEGLSIFKLR